ncbi:hypothetical protein [Mucilaginibacter sp.]|uniref:hypothetical protein n=1 Tax=Mucilaginibacter sp. TaxID=1882438 RepID=UPI0026197ADE|nr:hypothetical protein [Mucilaginibacter sp.]MDB5031856.1 hypothetical protein [Mucilaginibacter sp.]
MKKKIIVIICLLFGLYAGAVELADPPQATITNGLVTATLYLPDAEKGHYQATRFDWSGIISSLEYGGHSFYGKWSDSEGPKVHDAVMGPAESYAPLGYSDATTGGTFIRIGVGVLRKPKEKAYSEYKLYDIVDGGKWTVSPKKDRVEFTQELHDSTGYAFIYKKTVRLVKGKPQMVLEHSLKNTGTKVIETDMFNHNFPVIDKEPTGPNIKFIFPFDVNEGIGGRGWGTVGKTNGKEINFLRALNKNEQLYSAGLQGLGGTYKDYDIKMQNQKTGAGIHVTSDQALEKLVYWACPTTACPEPYIKISVAPGKEMKWNTNYEYYTFTPDTK